MKIFAPLEKSCFLKHFILTGFFIFTAQFAYSSDKAIVLKDNINVRVDATAMSPLLGVLSKNDMVTIVDQRFDWYKIILPKSFSVFASDEFLDSIANNKVKVEASKLNLRNGPSMSSYVIGTVEKGTVLLVKGRKGNWVELRGYPHAYGWVNKVFLRKIDSVVNLEGILYPFDDGKCEANYVLDVSGKKYYLNIRTKGRTKFTNKKVKIEGVKVNGSCPYIIVHKLRIS